MKRTGIKRIIAIFIVVIIVSSVMPIQVFAALKERPTGSVTVTTGTLNALNGGNSARWSITLPPLPSGSVITGITFTITVRGDPCYLYIQSPDGTIMRYGPFGQGTYTITVPSFNGAYAQGTWYFWIQTLGTITTATLGITFYYFYP